MSRLHALLAATDLSAPSRHAAQRAAMLAQQSGAHLELVHALEKSAIDELLQIFERDGAALQERIRQQAHEELSQLAVDIGEPNGLSIGHRITEGEVLQSIGNEADALDASLLVIGAHGVGFMRHWLLGATAERLLRQTLRPILIVKQPPHESYRSVLVPVDFSPWSEQAVHLARAIAPQAEIILLHAFEAPFEGKLRFAGVSEEVIRRHSVTAHQHALARLRQLAADIPTLDGHWRPLVLHGDAAPLILEQEEELGADLIVLGKHGVGMIEELLLGSVTKHVLAQARGDVLVAAR